MVDATRVGERLAALREDRNLTPVELSSRSGIPEAEIEAIESALLSPSIAPMIKLSRALGVRLGTFFDDAEGKDPVVVRANEAAEVMRAPGRVSPKMGAMSFFSLAQGKTGRSMEPFIVELHPGSGDGPAPSSHEGEEFFYVLEGAVDLRYGSDTVRLAPGDSVYYDSLVPHRVSSAAPARVLAVVYAPF